LGRVTNRPLAHGGDSDTPDSRAVSPRLPRVRTAAMTIPIRLIAALVLVPSMSSAAQAGLIFNLTNSGTATAPMMAGFTEACGLWSAMFDDPTTINITVNAVALAPGQIGGTNAFFDPYDYTLVRSAMIADATSADDASGTAALQPGGVFSMLINRTKNSPSGVVSATPYFDTGLGGPGQAGAANNSKLRITSANAKALGIYPGNASDNDGSINISTLQPFDFDRSNGIDAGKVDFVGVAAHEIGHLLGFLSGVDNLDGNGTAPGLNDNQLVFVTPFDMFRFSSRSIAAGGGVGVIDWTVDNTAKYFSVDGGLTSLGALSTGSKFGDGYEAHHWKNSLAMGIMDPQVSAGQLLAFSNLDRRAFDAIGYDLIAVPEPSSLGAVAILVLVVGSCSRLRCRKDSLHAGSMKKALLHAGDNVGAA